MQMTLQKFFKEMNLLRRFGLLEEAENLKKIVELYRPKNVFILFSGGKDSMVALDVFYRLYKTAKLSVKTTIIHIDTGIGISACKEFIREFVKRYPFDFKVLKPEMSFEEGLKKWGVPLHGRCRWCFRVLKYQPLSKFLKSINGVKLSVNGIRIHESSRRFEIYGEYLKTNKVYKGRHKEYSYCPILDWNREKVEEYIKVADLPVNPVYKAISMSGECMCMLHDLSEEKIMKIKRFFPEDYERLMNIFSKADLKGKEGVKRVKKLEKISCQCFLPHIAGGGCANE